jgi:hypothetical protein
MRDTPSPSIMSLPRETQASAPSFDHLVGGWERRRRHIDALDRCPKLAEALARAKKAKAPVVVAKLCRLSRDVAFISGLMAQRVPFIVAERGRTPIRSCCTFTRPWPRKSGH